MKKPEQILRSLGLNQTYTGYENTLKAVDIILKDKHTLYSVTRAIYQPIAEGRGCTWSAVERSIRTAVMRAWNVNPELVMTMAGYRMSIQPTAAEFIEMVALYAEKSD